MMSSAAILEKIIDENGNCCWATQSVCSICPLGRIARHNGKDDYMSCVEALAIDGLSEEEADARYKAAAEQKLADLMIEEAIES